MSVVTQIEEAGPCRLKVTFEVPAPEEVERLATPVAGEEPELTATTEAKAGCGASFLLFIGIMVYTVRAGQKIEKENYWEDELGTLEWTLPNPPPAHTFETLPTREMWDKQPGH